MMRLEPGDMLEVIPRLKAEGVIVDAVVTDPPYDLVATAKRFGKKNSAPAQYGRDGAMSRLSGGFMGCQWDATEIAFRPETWDTVKSILRPGGFLLAFGGTRTCHRMTCAIEDSGFVIQDCILWLYGSGFPKRKDTLKPAYEPIVVAYNPGGKRTLQADECRIGTNSGEGWNGGIRRKPMEGDSRSCIDLGMFNPNGRNGEPSANQRYTANGSVNFSMTPGPRGGDQKGRWPANICHDGSDEVMEAFAVFGETGGRSKNNEYDFRDSNNNNAVHVTNNIKSGVHFSDSGTAARFFYSSKAGAEDRFGSRHPTVKPLELMKWLVPLVTPKNGTVLDPFAGSGTTGIAAFATGRDAILIEQEPQYVSDIRERIAFYEGEGRHSMVSKNRNKQEKTGSLL